MTNPLVSQIVSQLRADNVTKKKGLLKFELAGISIEIDNKDVLGGILQSWFSAWLNTHGYNDLQEATQQFPDYLFKGEIYLELKTFNSEATPAFDVANFASYVDSLLIKPQRLNSDYLIMSYKVESSRISIVDFWVKKVWEITGPSETNILKLQVKRGEVYNIRPKTWYNGRVETFSSRKDFVIALWQAGMRFETPSSCDEEWFAKVESVFKKITGSNL